MKCITFVCLQVGAFSVLKELVVVLPDCLAEHIGSLIPGIEKALNVCEFCLKSDVSLVLNFLHYTVHP
jgi:hypothetical protein